MSIVDDYKLFTLRVADGSGILVKTTNPDKWYVLTAWHCIELLGKDIPLTFAPDIDIDAEFQIRDVFHDDAGYAAIIVVDKIEHDFVQASFAEKPNYPEVKCCHTGFPECTKTEKGREFRSHGINKILDDHGSLVRYQYSPQPLNKELKGMSGGAIIDYDFQIYGLHEASEELDEDEMLGYGCYIPVSRYTALIRDKNLDPIAVPESPFDLSCFKDFESDIFSFSQFHGIEVDLEDLLSRLAYELSKIMQLSPRELYNAFQNARAGCTPVPCKNLIKEHWISFGEFVLVASIMLEVDLKDGVDKLYSKYQFVQSDKDFDLAYVRKELNPILVGKVSADTKIVIGGIRSSGYDYDVMSSNIPDVANARETEELDIATTGRGGLSRLTFINSRLFWDALKENSKAIKGCHDDKMAFYLNLLDTVINGSGN